MKSEEATILDFVMLHLGHFACVFVQGLRHLIACRRPFCCAYHFSVFWPFCRGRQKLTMSANDIGEDTTIGETNNAEAGTELIGRADRNGGFGTDYVLRIASFGLFEKSKNLWMVFAPSLRAEQA
jgi:hypothetical protein